MGDSESDVSDVWASLPKQFGAMDDYSRKSTGGGGKKRKISTVVLEDMSTEEYWEVNFEIFERKYSSLFLKSVLSSFSSSSSVFDQEEWCERDANREWK